MLEIDSLRTIDGKDSIEHLISIHVADLVEEQHTAEVLTVLQYTMDYRIRGKRMQSLDTQVMRRLADGLLLKINPKPKQKKAIFFGQLRQVPTEALQALDLFADFLEEVMEFRVVVAEKPMDELSKRLQLSKWIELMNLNKEVTNNVVRLMKIIPTLAPHLSDLSDLVQSKEAQKAISTIPTLEVDTLLYPPPGLYFDRTIAKVERMFQTSLTEGLSDVEQRQSFYGKNIVPSPPPKLAILIILEQFKDFMVLLLLFSAILNLILHEYQDAGVLFFVVGLNSTIGFVQEYKASRQMQKLISQSVPECRVIRNKKEQIISSSELVPGDVVILEEGDLVPADLRIAESSQMEVMESFLTGETVGVLKKTKCIKSSTRKLALNQCEGNGFMSSVVVRGRGKGIVVRTGKNTEIGKISSAIVNAPHNPTRLQKKLSAMGIWLVLGTLLICFLVFLNYYLNSIKDLKTSAMLTIAVAVSAIPEGLVTVVTMTMVLAVWRMNKQNTIVRKLPSVESLGSVTVICSDKTGTLTEGNMSPKYVWTMDNVAFEFQKEISRSNLFPGEREPKLLELAMQVCAQCNNATITTSNGKITKLGDSTEIALLHATQIAKMDSYFKDWVRVAENPFDSCKKVMSVIVKNKTHLLLAKGAPECILQRCSHYLSPELKELNDEAASLITEAASLMASMGLRVLGLSSCVTDDVELDEGWGFIGLIGLQDPPRQGVVESVDVCKKAGIEVIMITGDHVTTAVSIAKDLGIMKDTDRAMRGAELDLVPNDLELKPFPKVFARVSPDNKLRIVQMLQRMGHSVAMTGDGVNDASAIKQADVGISMGISGTHVAKQAADIILVDDNFSTIVQAVREGRRVFCNIKKFIIYLLSCNSAEIWIAGICSFFEKRPLNSRVILWANIIADIPPALALGVDPAESDVMLNKPRNPNSNVLDKSDVFVILFQGFTMALLSLIIYFLLDYESATKDTEYVSNVTFASLTLMQLFQGFISRSLKKSLLEIGLVKNKFMVPAVILSVVLLVSGFYIPWLKDLLHLSSMSAIEWGWAFCCLLVYILISEFLKLMLRIKSQNQDTH